MRISDWSSDVCSSDLETPPACHNVWWFRPGHGTETLCIPTDDLDRHGYTYAPTRVGILRIQGIRHTPHGVKPGGFYLTEAAGRRAAARRVGEEGVSTCRYRVSPYHLKKKTKTE